LYRGASTLGDFLGDEPLPAGMAAHEVSPEKSARRFEQHVTTGPVATGGSAISTGSGVAIAGDGNVVITGKVGRDVKIDQHSRTGEDY
jgi:hypothetical protein